MSSASPSDHLADVAGFLETAEHHRRKEMAAMWLLGEAADKAIYGRGMTHNAVAAKTGVSMFNLCRALTIRATYPTLNHIPEKPAI